MPRQRKSQAKATPEPKLMTPSEAPARPMPAKPLIEIDEEEQWRIINESGVLKNPALKTGNINAGSGEVSMHQPEAEEMTLGDEIFNAMLLVIPFSSLLLLFEVLIRHQYGKEASIEVIMDRMVPGVPILSLFIFYTTRYKSHRRIQTLMFFISILTGTRMLWQYKNANWLVNMQQCPPLATIWIYTIVQQDLELCVASLAVVGLFVWYKGMSLF